MPSPESRDPRLRIASRFARDILPRVSRTFALSIRVLPGQLGAAVRCAYLLCRIADTIEDDPAMGADTKAGLFDQMSACLDDASAVDAFVRNATAVRGDDAHVTLVRRGDLVFLIYASLPEATRHHVRRWVREMIDGMRRFVLVYPGGIRIQSLDEYKEYCYYVAGTVGYMLTD